jgi:hypothetical protein
MGIECLLDSVWKMNAGIASEPALIGKSRVASQAWDFNELFSPSHLVLMGTSLAKGSSSEGETRLALWAHGTVFFQVKESESESYVAVLRRRKPQTSPGHPSS